MLRDLYQLAKPGIVYGNLVSALAGFFFGAGFSFSLATLLSLLAGLGCVIGSACVFNNYADRDMDAAMERTKGRALVAGRVTPHAALAYGAILGILGMSILWAGTGAWASLAAAVGFAVYVGLYTPLKPRTQHATLVGAVAGAMPIVVGYAAAVQRVDVNTVVLFLILALWQMPHFYAIALYRLDEYAAARIPVVSIIRDVPTTVLLIRIYIGLFALAVITPSIIGAAGWTSGVAGALAAIWWSTASLKPAHDASAWGKKVFRLSLIVLLVSCAALSVSTLFP